MIEIIVYKGEQVSWKEATTSKTLKDAVLYSEYYKPCDGETKMEVYKDGELYLLTEYC